MDGDKQRVNQDPDRNSARETVASSQGDAFARHSHRYNYMLTGGQGGKIKWGGDAKRTTAHNTTEATGGNETRPKNVAVYWLMRAR